MKKYIVTLLICILLCKATAQYDLQHIYLNGLQLDSNGLVLDSTSSFADLQKFTKDNLRIYLLLAKEQYLAKHQDMGNYMNLQTALQQNKILIEEVSAGGTVNTLLVSNTSHSDTIMLIAGDVITGGKQNRVVSQDIILIPGEKKKNISVFCVEPHRWNGQNGLSFRGYFGTAATSVRKAAVTEKNQGKVWQDVGKINKKLGTETNTGTYTAIQNNKQFDSALQQYLEYFKPLVVASSLAIGMVAVSGTEILSADVFATPKLFQNNLDNILKSVVTEAISNGSAPSVSQTEMGAFLGDFLGQKNLHNQSFNLTENGSSLDVKGKKAHIQFYKTQKIKK